jgi:hypothetical protein
MDRGLTVEALQEAIVRIAACRLALPLPLDASGFEQLEHWLSTELPERVLQSGVLASFPSASRPSRLAAMWRRVFRQAFCVCGAPCHPWARQFSVSDATGRIDNSRTDASLQDPRRDQQVTPSRAHFSLAYLPARPRLPFWNSFVRAALTVVLPSCKVCAALIEHRAWLST